MVQLMDAAAYVVSRYASEHNVYIDEMKLHKLLYFAQRESFVQTGQPLFDATFYGWKYGPVLKEIRTPYKMKSFHEPDSAALDNEALSVMDVVFRKYAEKDSWSLSRLSHGELSWKNSRVGVGEEAYSNNPMHIEDIKMDAERIKKRRMMRKQLGLA